MQERTMSTEEFIMQQRERVKREDMEVLNLLYQSALISVEAAQEQIAAMNLDPEVRDQRIEQEQAYLRVAKFPSDLFPWQEDSIPRSRHALIAFRNELAKMIPKYLIYEKRGRFYAL